MVLGVLLGRQKFKTTLFIFPRASLKFLGIWPENPLNAKTITLIGFNLGILMTAIIAELAFAYKNFNNLELTLDTLCPCITKLVTFAKIIILLIYRKEFNVLIRNISNLMTSETKHGYTYCLQKYTFIASMYGFGLFSFGHTTNIMFSLRPIIENCVNYLRGWDLKRTLPFQAMIPYNISMISTYIPTYGALSYSGVTTVNGFVGVDGSFIALCLYLSAQFEIIQHDIMAATENIEGDKLSSGERVRVLKLIKKAVEKHNEISQVTKELVYLFDVIIIMHFVSAGIIICMSSVDFILAKGFGALLYLSYNVSALLQLFIYCAGGDFIAQSSTKIHESVYNSSWYKCDPNIRKMLLIIMTRTGKGDRVDAPFFSPSLSKFGIILRSAGSYITLLNTFL